MILSTRTAKRRHQRRGIVIPLLALAMVCLVGFLALAIDIGMLCVAKTQTQHAADLAALTAARTLNGDKTSTYNNTLATTNAQNILTWNYILGQPIQPTQQLTLTYGSYDYNQNTQAFNANYPATSGNPYTAVQAKVVTISLPGAFSTVFGTQYLPNLTATAEAVHRPRDIALVMDLSGSMRMGTCLRYDFYTSSGNVSNNPDTDVPTFGHYSSSSAGMVAADSNRTSAFDNYSLPGSNTTVPNSSYTLTYINSYYQNDAYATTLVRAFDSYTSTDSGKTWSAPAAGATPQLPTTGQYTSTPGGDVPLFSYGSTTNYAQTLAAAISSTASTARNAVWELDGYSACSNGTFNGSYLTRANYPSSGAGAFYGYTQGPNYYGKTFFIWPPDPRRANLTTSGITWTSPNGGTSGGTDAAQIKQFLTDFGYTAADFNNTVVATTISTGNSINASATTLKVTSAANFPATGQFRVRIDSEILLVTGGQGTTTWTVQRGQDGTTAASHSAGAAVGLATGPALYGIYCVTTTSGSQTWPWPSGDDASGTVANTLSNYLVNNVYKPGGSRLLTTSDQEFQNIMRLYNWRYVLDSTGSTHCDWRLRFFGTADNTAIFKTTGGLRNPGSSNMWPSISGTTDKALATYNAFLTWIRTSPDPFPTQMRSGRIKYYSSIPTQITGTWPNYGGTDQRFWVEFIDHVLGYRQTAAGTYQDISAMAGYGADFTWGTLNRRAAPSSTQYMKYDDNPARPRLRHWFSPILMVDFLHNYNMSQIVNGYFPMQPGNSYEAPLYTAKEAYMAAITTMENNHPNDWFSLICYSWPRTAANSGVGRFNCVTCPLGTNYSYAKAALLFPFSTINSDGSDNNTEVTPYDSDPATGTVPSANFVDTGRGDGDTCFAMGLMLAYNQFAVTKATDSTLRNFVSNSPINFPTGMAGGMGRNGAQKVVIFETDGLANCSATASLVSSGSYKYYQVRYDMNNPTASEYPTINATVINDSTVLSQVYSLVDQLKSDYGTTRNPFRLYALGYGPVFEGSDASSALTVLQNMQYHAGTQTDPNTALPSSQIITGTDSTMSANMISTFTSILQNGVQIALIK